MLASSLIVFREVFEMAIIISVVLAATKGLSKRSSWVYSGIVTGAACASVVGIMLHIALSQLGVQMNDTLFHALILLTVSVLLIMSVLWMRQHGRVLVQNIKNLGTAIIEGRRHMAMLAVVVGLAVFREGTEIVLFLLGIATTGDTSIFSIILGSLIGLSLGIVAGALMYLGLLRIPVHYLFSVTSWLLTFIACGMMANAAGKLAKVHWLPVWRAPLWDTSWLLSQKSLLGKFLHILVGYLDSPAGIQVAFYLGTLMIVVLLSSRKLTKQAA